MEQTYIYYLCSQLDIRKPDVITYLQFKNGIFQKVPMLQDKELVILDINCILRSLLKSGGFSGEIATVGIDLI